MSKKTRSDLGGNLGGFFPLIHEQDYDGMNYTNDIWSEEPWKDPWDVEKAQWTDLDYLLNAGTQK